MSIENKIKAGILEGWEVVTKIDIETGVSSVTIDGINGDEDTVYLLVTLFKNPTGTNAYVLLKPNGNIVGSWEYLYASGTSIGANSLTDWNIANIYAGQQTFAVTIFYAKTGVRRRYIGHESREVQVMVLRSGVWDDTTTPVTSLTLDSGVAGAMGAGSMVLLCKLSKHKTKGIRRAFEKIVETEIETAVTSFDIEVDGESDELYIFTSLMKTSAAGANFQIQPNAITTNHYTQQIRALDTTYSLDQPTIPVFLNVYKAGQEGYSGLVFYYAKSGVQRRYVCLCSSPPSTGTLYIWLRSGVWNETVTKITYFRIYASDPNEIGPGSRFILYRLRS